MLRLLALSCLCVAPVANALPLQPSFALPQLTLGLLLAQTAPPVVVPDAPNTPPGAPVWQAPPLSSGDHVRLRDGRELFGKILSQVQDGFLFSDPSTNTTFVIQFKDIVDLQRAGAVGAPPSVPGERSFLLNAELRDLQARSAAISIWPSIEELIGGTVGVAGGVILFAVFGTADTIVLVFAGLAAVVGLVSVISGTVSLVSAENRKTDLENQIARVQDQLSRLPPIASAFPTPPMVAFRF